MITTVAALLHELQLREAARLKTEKITHPGTIGDMYEGLTRELLDRAIPPALDVKVVSGFVEGVDGALGPQTDAMVVHGDGKPVPYTDAHVWPIDRVHAVIEVKKTLYGADLDDGFKKLRRIYDMHDNLMKVGHENRDLSMAFRAFAKLSGVYPRSVAAANELSEEMSYIFHSHVGELLAPVRVILGYEGYADEGGLRRGLVNYLQENMGVHGFGVRSLPSLIVCRNNSLLKLNGQPYTSQLDGGGYWPIVASNSENPIRLLVELIWARLSSFFQTSLPVNDSLENERIASLLAARIKRVGDKVGWEFRWDDIPDETLASLPQTSWKPEDMDENETVLFWQILRAGELKVSDAEFNSWATESGLDAGKLIEALVTRRLIAWCDDETVRPIEVGTFITTFTPDGHSVTTAETELLQLWLKDRST